MGELECHQTCSRWRRVPLSCVALIETISRSSSDQKLSESDRATLPNPDVAAIQRGRSRRGSGSERGPACLPEWRLGSREHLERQTDRQTKREGGGERHWEREQRVSWGIGAYRKLQTIIAQSALSLSLSLCVCVCVCVCQGGQGHSFSFFLF